MAGTAYVPYGISVLNQSGDLDGAARAAPTVWTLVV